MSIAVATPRHCFGLKADVADNICYLDEQTIIYPSGSNCILFNIDQKSQRFIPGTDKSAGMTALAVSPNRRYVAIAEKGEKATITIYDLNTLRKKKVLCSAEVQSTEFVSLAFSPDSKYLVSQGGRPDWTLLYWTWEKAKVMAVTKSTNQMNSPVYQVNNISELFVWSVLPSFLVFFSKEWELVVLEIFFNLKLFNSKTLTPGARISNYGLGPRTTLRTGPWTAPTDPLYGPLKNSVKIINKGFTHALSNRLLESVKFFVTMEDVFLGHLRLFCIYWKSKIHWANCEAWNKFTNPRESRRNKMAEGKKAKILRLSRGFMETFWAQLFKGWITLSTG